MKVVHLKIEEGDEEGARERLREILKMAPDSIEANYMLAYLEIRNGNYEGASEYAAEMIAASPDNPTGHNLKGITLLGMGRIHEARRAFEKNTVGFNQHFSVAITTSPNWIWPRVI